MLNAYICIIIYIERLERHTFRLNQHNILMLVFIYTHKCAVIFLLNKNNVVLYFVA